MWRKPTKAAVSEVDKLREQLSFGMGPDMFVTNAGMLLSLLQLWGRDDAAANVAWCIRAGLEADDGSSRIIVNNNGIPILVKALNTRECVPACEHIVQVLAILSKMFASQIAEQLDYEVLLSSIGEYQIVDQRAIMGMLVRVSEVLVTKKLEEQYGRLMELSGNADAAMAKAAMTVLIEVAGHVTASEAAPDMVAFLVGRLANDGMKQSCMELPAVIARLVKSQEAVRVVLNGHIDFENLLLGESTKNDSGDSQIKILRLILVLLPVNYELAILGAPRNPTPPESVEFAHSIQPVLVKVLREKPLRPRFVLLALALTLSVCPRGANDQIVSTLMPHAMESDLRPYVLAVIAQFPHDMQITISGVLNVLSEGREKEPQDGWFRKTLDGLKSKVNEHADHVADYDLTRCNLSKFAELVSSGELSPSRFLFNGMPHAQTILRGQKPSIDVDIVNRFGFSLVEMISLPRTFVQPSVLDFLDFLARDVELSIIYGRARVIMMVPSGEDLALVEGMIFREVDDIKQIVRAAIGTDSSLSKYIGLSVDELWVSHFPVVSRALSHDSNLHLVFDGGYDEGDTVMGIMCDKSRGVPNFNGPLNMIATQRASEPRCVMLRQLEPQTELIMSFLEFLHKEFGTAIITPSFVSKIREQLAHPFCSVGRQSQAIAIIFRCPFLFPFNERLLAFRLTILDMYTALRHLITEFGIDTANRIHQFRRDALLLVVERESVWEDGLVLLKHFLTNRLRISIQFRGEDGLGMGPAREFFGMLSREFVRSSRGLFRNSRPNDEFCFCQQGLFPAVNAQPDLFRLLGVLVAKAITLEITTELDFNPAFFALVRGLRVPCSDVDEVLARSLKTPKGLYDLDFTYPGCPEVALIPNGASKIVNASNVRIYVHHVEEWTTSRTVCECAAAFRAGFELVMHFDNLRLFECAEITKLIRGEQAIITASDLAYVDTDGGYTRESPEIMILFEILMEMTPDEQRGFLVFVTGSQCLPVGGLKALEPRMLIMKRSSYEGADGDLPTSSTCRFMLKLPPYTKKDTMKAKLLAAIEYGSDSFGLT